MAKKVSSQKPQKSAPDPEWAKLLDIWAEAETAHLGFQAGSAFYTAIGEIAGLYTKYKETWSEWLRAHGIKTHPTKPFRALIGLLTKGHSSKSWASKISSVLDEWNEVLREEYGDPAYGGWLADFLDSAGGITEIYQERLKRLGTTKARKRKTTDKRIASLLEDRAELIRQRDEYKERAEGAEADCEDLREQLELERQKRIAA